MAFDRDATLKQGEKFLRQGRLDAAIAEYARVVEDQPRDLTTANLLGDLYVRASQPDRALTQYQRIAEHLVREGFYPKASALYRKILKLQPDDEQTELVLAEICAKQGQLADAKSYLTAVGQRRRERGDKEGAADVALRLSALDPTDIPTRLSAARTLEEMGWTADAAGHFRSIYDDLRAQRRSDEALDALRDAVRLNPSDRDGRTVLARTAVEAGDVLSAQPYLDRETAGQDPVLLAALVEVELRTGHHDSARGLMSDLLAVEPTTRGRLLKTAWALCDSDPDASYLCIEAVVDATVVTGEYTEAAAHLEAFAERRPHHIPSLMRLVEVCVDGDLDAPLNKAQGRLADAYLEVGQAAEARVIAEDLLAREPDEEAHVERLRLALVQLEIPDPEAYIADRLSAQPEFFANLELSEVEARFDDAPTAAAADVPGPAVERLPPAPAVERLGNVARVQSTGRIEPPVVVPALDAPAAAPDAPPASLDAPAAALAEVFGRAPAGEPDLEPVLAPALAMAGAAGAADPDQEIDLTSLLSGGAEMDLTAIMAAPEPDPDAKSVDLDSVFSELRSDAEEQTNDEFAAQYMKLARTYVDMGMVDEAVTALQTPVKAPRYRFEAASLLGRLHMKRGETAQALEWLERAADVPAPTVQEGRALLYDLGVLLEGAGETPRALAVFLELQADAGDYRDVPTRIDRLARV